tara:strand:+ start:1970 stop:2161 length:192 start_codon:yes stop_codon:yes gene_type:complete
MAKTYKYLKSSLPSDNSNAGIVAVDDTDNSKMSIPLDPANSDYAEIMRQVEAGELAIQPADSE